MSKVSLLSIFLLTLLATLGVDRAHATQPNFYYETGQVNVENAVLGRSCYSLRGNRNSLTCNPANLAKQIKSQLYTGLLVDQRLTQTIDYAQMIEDEETLELVNELLSKSESYVTRGSINLWYQYDWWYFAATPFRGAITSRVRNPAYPRFYTQVVREREISGGWGLFWAEEPRLQFGLKARLIDRHFLDRQFDLLDALANPEIIRMEKSSILYLEPGLVYDFRSAWNSQFSVSASNLRIFQDGAKDNAKYVIDFGFSSEPDFLDFIHGQFRSTAHFAFVPGQTKLANAIRWSGIYEIDPNFSISFTLANAEYGIGLSGRLDSLTFGIGFRREEVRPSDWETTDYDQVLGELALSF